ncbi:MAG TPA: hypothetical protein VMN58_06905 [Acidimicrobiales bacterium]|nr:hypothetical protein [Acidimicrobiales bacterium]
MTLMTEMQAMDMAANRHHARHATGRAWPTGLVMPGIASGDARGSFVTCTGTLVKGAEANYVATGRTTTPSNGTRRPWDPLL